MPDEPIEAIKADDTLQKDVVLNHIDKLYTTLTKIWDSANRLILTETILVVILIVLCTGYVSVDEVSLAGIKFKISLTAILLLGVAFVTILHFAFLYQFEASNTFRLEIIGRYESINYKTYKTSKHDYQNDAFTIPNIYVSAADLGSSLKGDIGKWVRIYRTIWGLVSELFVIAVPIAVQIAVGLKVAALYEWAWWIIGIFILLIILTVICIVAHISSDTFSR